MIYVFGAGYMAKQYLNALKELECGAEVVSLSSNSANVIKSQYRIKCYSGGYSNFKMEIDKDDIAIVCTPVEILSKCTKYLIEHGFKRILLEKPGAIDIAELTVLNEMASIKKCNVSIAYNRRFFSSVTHLRELLKAEKLLAVDFEITEWTHRMNLNDYSDAALSRWFLSNTSHVADLVFDVAGEPRELTCYTSGSLPWHKASSRFSGSGRTVDDVLISYKGFWDAPGRWSAEFITHAHRYYLCPMEKLYCQEKGSVDILEVANVDYSDDEICKPGVKKMLQAFQAKEYQKLCSLSEQISNFQTYYKMANYN